MATNPNMQNNLNQLLKQAQDMQKKMQDAQQQLANLVISGESGGGLVKFEMDGKHNAKRITIDPSVIKEEEKEVLEDLIVAAINDTIRKIEKASREKLSSLTAGLQMPGGFNSPFGGGDIQE